MAFDPEILEKLAKDYKEEKDKHTFSRAMTSPITGGVGMGSLGALNGAAIGALLKGKKGAIAGGLAGAAGGAATGAGAMALGRDINARAMIGRAHTGQKGLTRKEREVLGKIKDAEKD